MDVIVFEEDGQTFSQAVLIDYAEFRKNGLEHPDMLKIEQLYDVTDSTLSH